MKQKLLHVQRTSHMPHLDLVVRTDPIRFRTHPYLNTLFPNELRVVYIDVLLIDESRPVRGVVVEQVIMSRGEIDVTTNKTNRHVTLTEGANLVAIELVASNTGEIAAPTLLIREEWIHRKGGKVTATPLSPMWL